MSYYYTGLGKLKDPSFYYEVYKTQTYIDTIFLIEKRGKFRYHEPMF